MSSAPALTRASAHPHTPALTRIGLRIPTVTRANLCTLALARANLRYWPTVAPIVREQLGRWEARAARIADSRRRALALGKLRTERFNPQLAATLATQAPRAHRRTVTEAIVAVQIAYDYLDALGEQREHTGGDGEHTGGDGEHTGGDAYTRELLASATDRLARLPAARAVEETARRAGERCVRAQALSHAAQSSGDDELARWASAQAAGTSLCWPEWLAGAQASVLVLHALIAAAAREDISPSDAEALDRLYLSIGALTMLDSLIDRDEDLARGERGYARWYEDPEQMGEHLAAAARDALARTPTAPGHAHHLMTLTGVVAYYASEPAARDPGAREVFTPVRAELGGALGPALAVMRTWRFAKRVTYVLRRATGRRR